MQGSACIGLNAEYSGNYCQFVPKKRTEPSIIAQLLDLKYL
jgi:hypothetical protein